MKVYLKLLFVAFFWGGTFIAGRIIAGDVKPFPAAFLRFFVASFFLLVITKKQEGHFPRIQKDAIFPTILLGLTGVFTYNVFFFKGLELIGAGRASLIIATNPICITLLAAFFFKERLNLIQIIGIACSVIGAVIVITKGELTGLWSGGFGRGEFYILCCVASWVTYSLIGKKIMTSMSPLVSVTYSSIAGMVFLFWPAFCQGLLTDLFSYSAKDWGSIFYLGFFGTVLGFVWYYEGIKIIGPGRASLFINFVPVSAIFLAFLILSEPITLSLLVGALFVVFGVFLTNSIGTVKSD